MSTTAGLQWEVRVLECRGRGWRAPAANAGQVGVWPLLGCDLESGMTRWSCVTVVGGRARPDGESPACRSRGTTVGRSCETVVGWSSTTECGGGRARPCAVGVRRDPVWWGQARPCAVRVRRDPVRRGSGER